MGNPAQTFAEAIKGMHIAKWSKSVHSNGKKYVYVTFHEDINLGKIK